MAFDDREHLIAFLRDGADSKLLFDMARRRRDEGHGRTVTFSRKVFIPVTNLCRDACGYCTFSKTPEEGGRYLSAQEALDIARAGESFGCTEALLTCGDHPESRWSEAERFLEGVGHQSTVSYVADLAGQILGRTSLFPHVNLGIISEPDVALLRPVSASMGLMLENISPRLMEPGMPHHLSPDKEPGRRVTTMENAGRLLVPFTTGILIGIGETPEEVIDSLRAISQLQSRFGNIQEVIVQNFRAKPDTSMRFSPEPEPGYFRRVVAAARLIMDVEMNLQVPPNLTDSFETLLAAGINDWGGVSPVTIDWVNPEAPWPHLDELSARTESAGFELKPRLPVYPRYLDPKWLDPMVFEKAIASVDAGGFVAEVPGLGLS